MSESAGSPALETRIADLLAQMTLEEKVGQLCQVPAAKDRVPHLEQLIRDGKVGSLILASTAYAGNEQQHTARVEELNHLQHLAVEETRLGIPLLYGRDIIHGCRTVFPIPLAQAASFNPALVEQCAAIAAAEGRRIGAHWTFAPMVDIARDGRWGRIAEGFGEDPFLCGALAQASVHGFQGNDPSQPERLLACAKHFLAYGAAEAGRDYNTAECTDNTLLNTYAPSFRAAIEAGAATIMSAFHELGGEPVVASRRVMVDLLRRTLGFAGMVVTDWGSVWQLLHHGVASDTRQCAKLAIEAANDMEMGSNCYADNLVDLVRTGQVEAALLEDSVRRVLRAKFQAGLFERPYTDVSSGATTKPSPTSRALARQAAGESIVLLKNDGGQLPLQPGKIKSIALIGPLAEEQDSHLGTWSMDGLACEVVSIAAALRQRFPETRILTCPHLTDVMLMHVQAAEVVLLCLGENCGRSGEDNSVASLDLPPGQSALLEAVADMGKPVVTVICAARPLAIPQVFRRAQAVVWAWHLGVEAGNAIADVLVGAVNPGAKMPVTMPRALGQVPIYYNRKRTGRPVSKQHIDLLNEPLVPFGFGLSYTQFTLSDLQLSSVRVERGQPVTVSVTVTNTGDVAGDEIVQCYIQDVAAAVTRPVRELKAFQRLHLKPGQSQLVTFPLRDRELGYYGPDGAWRVDAGEFRLWVGNCSIGGLETRFELT